jgi:serine/threonine protein phosphatase PrpC
MEDLNPNTGRGGTTALFDYAVVAVPFPGETDSGDAYLVRYDKGLDLVVVMDALGHGKAASLVADWALANLENNPILSVDQLICSCHEALKGTRGVVMNVVLIEGHSGSLTWAGVGDIESLLIRARKPDLKVTPRSKHIVEYLHSRPGVVGWSLPPTHVMNLELEVGDVLIMTTDGIRDEYVNDVDTSDDIHHIAEHIMSHYTKGHDDSLVLVLRWKGTGGPKEEAASGGRSGGASAR